MKLVKTATATRVPASRCSAMPIDDASIAQAAKPRAAKSRAPPAGHRSGVGQAGRTRSRGGGVAARPAVRRCRACRSPAAPRRRAPERLRDPPRCRRLAVGAGDGDDIEPAARVSRKALAMSPAAAFRPRSVARRGSAPKRERGDAVGLDEARRRALCERRGDEAGGRRSRGRARRRRRRPARRAAVGDQPARAAQQPARRARRRATRARPAAAIRSSPPRPAVAGDDPRLDLEVGRHAHHAQRLLHDLAEDRRGDVAAVVLAGARLVDHHGDDDARVARSARSRRTTRGTCCRVAAAFLLVRGAGLAADRVADDLRLRRGAARRRRHASASCAPPARSCG